MEKAETIDEFYQRKFAWTPASMPRETGHFNVFRLEPQLIVRGKPTPQRKRDYYKVTFVIGNSRIQYADKAIDIHKQALVFCHPSVPYQWDQRKPVPSGYFFVFNGAFLGQYGNFQQYPIFQPGNYPVFEIPDEHLQAVVSLFERMLEEIDSDYIYKYDALRNRVFELIHIALRLQPSAQLNQQSGKASQRIATQFADLLERQFPIDSLRQTVQLRSASDFAQRLNVHVNHLNRSIKEATQKTSTQLIAERLLQEAKILLKHSAWTVSEIAYALGFTEVTYFNSFFKKYTQLSPVKFRTV